VTIYSVRRALETHQTDESVALFADVRLQVICPPTYQNQEVVAIDAFYARESPVLVPPVQSDR
jgi:hypothetical protein